MHLERKNLLLQIINETIMLTGATRHSQPITLTRPGMPILCEVSIEMPKHEDLHDQRQARFLHNEPEMLEVKLAFKYPSHAIHILS